MNNCSLVTLLRHTATCLAARSISYQYCTFTLLFLCSLDSDLCAGHIRTTLRISVDCFLCYIAYAMTRWARPLDLRNITRLPSVSVPTSQRRPTLDDATWPECGGTNSCSPIIGEFRMSRYYRPINRVSIQIRYAPSKYFMLPQDKASSWYSLLCCLIWKDTSYPQKVPWSNDDSYLKNFHTLHQQTNELVACWLNVQIYKVA
jgi:hypothetical protein